MDEKLFRYFPESVREALQCAIALYGGTVDEIRMYETGNFLLVIKGVNVCTDVPCTKKILRETIGNLCGHSLYAHEDTIRQGYIFTKQGFRVGVAGRAVCRGDSVERIAELTSLCIRIPRRCPGASADIYPYVVSGGIPKGALVFSPPGVGKTTVLRELADSLSKAYFRVALIDTRNELSYGLDGPSLDVFRGYPRPFGMETAIRVMNPQFVICDEISTSADANAVQQCASSGAAVIASAHGGTLADLQCQPAIHDLLESDVFQTLVRLRRSEKELIHTFYVKKGGEWCVSDSWKCAVDGGSGGDCDPVAIR